MYFILFNFSIKLNLFKINKKNSDDYFTNI